MSNLQITEFETEDETAWDAYIRSLATSTFYHQIGRQNVVEKTYKHKPIYLIAKEEGVVKGVLPLFMTRSWFFDKKLVSVPFSPYGGVCAGKRTIKNAVVDKAYMLQKRNTKNAAYIHGPALEFPERLEERQLVQTT